MVRSRRQKRATLDKDCTMAASTIPHLANDLGVEKIFIGVKEFNCMGARAPYDHPHVYLDMGSETQTLCPYCSTLYVHDERLHADETEPKDCIASLAPPTASGRV